MRRRKHPKMVVPQGAPRGGGLTSRIYVHAALRQISCVLCGDVHEQQYLAAGLFDGDRHVGDLCARCLQAGPAGSANRLRQYVALAPSSSEVLALADVLEQTHKWSVTLEDVIEEEKTILRQRFSGLREDDLRKLVDERYREYLSKHPK